MEKAGRVAAEKSKEGVWEENKIAGTCVCSGLQLLVWKGYKGIKKR